MVSRMVSPAEMPSPSLTCLKRSMSMTKTVGRTFSSVLAIEMIASSRFMNSSRLGRPVRLSCTASCSSRSSAFFCSVTSTSVPTQRMHLAVRADHRPGAQREPVIVAVGAAQPEILRDAAAPVLEHDVERGAERVAVVGMQHRQPVAGRRRRGCSGARPSCMLTSGRVTTRSRSTSQSQTVSPEPVTASACRSRSLNRPCVQRAAGKGVLHDGEADQQDDQDQPAAERRLDDVVVEHAGDRHPRAGEPDQHHHPARHQHDGAVVAAGCRGRRSGRCRSSAVAAKESRAMPAATAGSMTATPAISSSPAIQTSAP